MAQSFHAELSLLSDRLFLQTLCDKVYGLVCFHITCDAKRGAQGEEYLGSFVV